MSQVLGAGDSFGFRQQKWDAEFFLSLSDE
jgi:hypothetical protein